MNLNGRIVSTDSSFMLLLWYGFEGIDSYKFKNKPKVTNSTAMFVVDCEMVLNEDKAKALVKVCVVW